MREDFADAVGEISIREGVARITFVGDDVNGMDRVGMVPKFRVILPAKGLLGLHGAISDLIARLETAARAAPEAPSEPESNPILPSPSPPAPQPTVAGTGPRTPNFATSTRTHETT